MTKKKTPAPSLKLTAIRGDLRLQVLDQDEAIDLVLTAVAMNDHIALVGPQGEAKTLLAQRVAQYLPGSYYYHLLTRFSTPDEVLGHYSLAKLQQDIYERRTDDKAPEAELVVLDEVFKANSPMLNSLLGLMNERVVDGIDCKLRTLVGLSNEWPRAIDSLNRVGDDESLLPLWDRFVMRIEIKQPQSDDTFRAVMRNQLPTPSASPLTDKDLDIITEEVNRLHRTLPKAIVDALLEVKAELMTKGIQVSTRRWYKASRVLCAYAVVLGDNVVKFQHLKVLRHVLWQVASQRAAVEDAVMQSGAPETQVALSIEAACAKAVEAFRKMDKSNTDRPLQRHDLMKNLKANATELQRILDDKKTVDREEVERVRTSVISWYAELMDEMNLELSL